ncbi:MAG: ISNCY family transposase [Methylocystis sp.]|nr:ISNCY family transposase [Methylocystis sp.]
MGRTEARQGVRMMKFLDILSRYEAAEFSHLEAVELLGVGERTFRRWRQRYEEEGEAGLLDRRLGKASGKRVPVDRSEEVEALYRGRYAGFTAKHFLERLVRTHGFKWGYAWTKTFLQARGLLEKTPKRGAHRRKRARRPLPGMMLHQDGSKHGWLAGQPALDLIVTLDDATSQIYSAFLVEEEGTASTFRALAEVFGEHGLPLSLYTDRGSHYFHTPEAGGKVDRSKPTQVGRALAHLGVEHIAAYSPHRASARTPVCWTGYARGRSERVFQTLQDRLVKELALAGIDTVEAANRFLREVYIPSHNARFAVAPAREGSAFVAISGVDLCEILCVQEERQVGNDNCVSFNRLKLQIPESPLRAHFVKARVKVRCYPDGTHAVFHGPRCLARYKKGALQEERKAA